MQKRIGMTIAKLMGTILGGAPAEQKLFPAQNGPPQPSQVAVSPRVFVTVDTFTIFVVTTTKSCCSSTTTVEFFVTVITGLAHPGTMTLGQGVA